MAALYTAEEILSITEGRMALGMMHETAGEICIDSRELQEGQWFIALQGKNFDGHDFIGEAYSKGALGCIVEERSSYAIASTSFPLLAVENTSQSLQTLARNWRKRIGPRIALIPVDLPEIQNVLKIIKDDLEQRFGDGFLYSKHTEPHRASAEILAMSDDVRFIVSPYRFQSLHDLQAFGQVLIPHVALISEETISPFRLQLQSSDLPNIPFWLMPSLKMNQGLALIESSFAKSFLPHLADEFRENVVLFELPEPGVDRPDTTAGIDSIPLAASASSFLGEPGSLKEVSQMDNFQPLLPKPAVCPIFTQKMVSTIVSAMRAN
jgi:hypothetical protein